VREVTFPGDNNRPEGAWPCSNQNERWTGRAHHERIMSTELAEIGNAFTYVKEGRRQIVERWRPTPVGTPVAGARPRERS